MADKSAQLVQAALSRAVADPVGMPLHGSKAKPGLFAGTALGKQAAQRCKDEGLLRLVTAGNGKATHELYTISDKGLDYLFSQVNPRQVLEDIVRALEGREGQITDLLATAHQMRASLDALKHSVREVLQQIRQQPPPGTNGAAHPPPPAGAWIAEALAQLAKWQASGASEDYPLPELCRQLRLTVPGLTIGQFHDGLRRLRDQGQIYLHPWTGPLCDLPEPPYALLVGHEIAYYASPRP